MGLVVGWEEEGDQEFCLGHVECKILIVIKMEISKK